MDLKLLTEPFKAEEIEWRVSRAGQKANGDLWAKILAYVTNRAIMDRFDEVCEPQNWKNEFREWQGSAAVLCGISIKIDGEWVTKWDASENTDIEAVKGGISGSQKRAAVQWGVGRYLYLLEETWANIHDNGTFAGQWKDRDGKSHFFKYDPPDLPKWALPRSDLQTMVMKYGNEIAQIKEGIFNDDWATAAKIWFEVLPKQAKEVLWVAPTKGGPFTTEEREIIHKAEFRKAHYGEPNGL